MLPCRRDGHIWVEQNDTDNDDDFISWLSMVLKKGGIVLNNKIYGGILQALDTVDRALVMSGSKTLLEHYNENREKIFMGEPGVCYSRISVVEKGQGGIY